jgi:hypothetical protein
VFVRAVALVSMIAFGGCVRDPVEAICPPIGAGDLVVTEIRGPQDDSLGPWIELYNASASEIDLAGIKIRFGDTQTIVVENGPYEDFQMILVRRSLTVPAGAYVVLGRFDDEHRPAHVDYGFVLNFDFEVGWKDPAVLGVDSCSTEIDRTPYKDLPTEGTYSFGGPPDAATNDSPADWCGDMTSVSSTFPGTPGAPNKACP